jgi:uncharacterized RDD family membrane protein YckC
MTQDRMVTPEAVALELPTAGAGTRLAAALLDWFIVGVGEYLLFLLVISGLAAAELGNADWLPGGVLVATTLFLFAFAMFGYFIISETLWRGRTAGKAALGLRVVTKEGGQIRFRHAFIRGIFLLIDGLASIGSVGVISILASRRSQRLGDMVAGTVVLRERTALRSPVAVTFAPPPGLEAYTAVLDTTRVGIPEYQAVRSFLMRANSLAPHARYELAVKLANPMRELVRPLPPDGVQPELFLAAVAAAHQRRQRATAPQPPRPPAPTPQPVAQPTPRPVTQPAPQRPPVTPSPAPVPADPQPWTPARMPPPQPEQAPPVTGQPGFAPPD